MASIGNNPGIAPDSQELEVSVFGSGYGECIVLHLGGDCWGVVDSCLDPGSKQPAALEYLKSIGVDIPSSLKFVVATHWHDDHIQGLSRVFDKAKAAVFACTEAVGQRDFTDILATWTGTKYLSGGSGVDELQTILAELKKRQGTTRFPAPKLASANKLLWEREVDPRATVKALSPSDAAVLASVAKLQTVAPRVSKVRRRLPHLKQNDASVVLSVQVGGHPVLLGADLQVRSDRGLGWMAIVEAASITAAMHQGFKVPHHGASNADHDEIWNRMLIPDAWAVISPFVSGRVRLPSKTDCTRMANRTKHCYLTAPPQPVRFRDPNRTVEKTVIEATISAHFVPGKYGHVRLRKSVREPLDSAWKVEMFGHALRLDDYVAALQ